MMRMRRYGGTVVAACLVLSGCGDLPQPFAGNPGAAARRLSQPPPSRLLVLPATNALLPDSGVAAFPQAIAGALADRGVPAIAEAGKNGDWRLAITAELQGNSVTPAFSVRNPADKPKGTVKGPPVPADEWQVASADTLKREAEAAAPAISDLLDKIEAAREESDPNSLLNRPPRVLVKGVTGAPGDGNTSLAHQISLDLGKGGVVIQKDPEGADYIVECHVNTVPAGPGTTRIELQWIVTDAQGREAGRVVQLNEVPSASITGLWGEAAIAAGQEAAAGVREVIDKQLRAPRNPSAKKLPPPPVS